MISQLQMLEINENFGDHFFLSTVYEVALLWYYGYKSVGLLGKTLYMLGK